MKYTKKPVTVEAHQWFKNGDHPEDNCGVYQRQTGPNGEMMDYTGEGNVVRYFRRPDVSGQSTCEHCGNIMHNHGWIDTLEGGHIVCPGDYIITGIKGERYPCKPDIFQATYSIGDELATLRAKAEAYDKGKNLWMSFDADTNEPYAVDRDVAVVTHDTWKLLGRHPQGNMPGGFIKKRVRVCEISGSR